MAAHVLGLDPVIKGGHDKLIWYHLQKMAPLRRDLYSGKVGMHFTHPAAMDSMGA
jgi:hypothetical protein